MRDHIISEIRRLAELAGGQPPGNAAFETATGIGSSKWRGKFWARWGDALIEAGFQPNLWTSKSDAKSIFDGLISASRHYTRYPTNSELDLLRGTDRAIPSPKTIRSNFGSQSELITAFKVYLNNKPEYADVLALLPQFTRPRPTAPAGNKTDGSVYLLKSGEFCKIGRSDNVVRRIKEITITLPEAVVLLHSIQTDDPSGIEAYWHRRFADRRANGEWFKLTPDDFKVFMRRKFQ